MIKIFLLVITLLLISYLMYLKNNEYEYMDNVKSIFDNSSLNQKELYYQTNKVSSNLSDISHQKCKKTTTCNVNVCGVHDLYPILDPKFNMREVSKQCLLLEDHLNNKNKRCIDCIKKHMLIIDGLLEEAVSLEQDNTERDMYRQRHKEWVLIEKEYSSNSNDVDTLDNVSKKIRKFRKPLVYDYFDMVSDYEI